MERGQGQDRGEVEQDPGRQRRPRREGRQVTGKLSVQHNGEVGGDGERRDEPG
ncbi:MAG TPA: hypothetical protein VGG75_40585 [Trebonia sp.]